MKFKPQLGNFVDLIGVTSAIAATNFLSLPIILYYVGLVQAPLLFGFLLTQRVKWLPKLEPMSGVSKIVQQKYTNKILDSSFAKVVASLEEQGFTVGDKEESLHLLSVMFLRKGLNFYENSQSNSNKWKDDTASNWIFVESMLQDKIKSLAVFKACEEALMDYGISLKFAMLTQSDNLINHDFVSNFKLSELETDYMKSMLISYECDLNPEARIKDIIEANEKFEKSKEKVSPYRLKYIIKLVKNNFQYAADNKTCILSRLEMTFDKHKNIINLPFKEYLSANSGTPAYALLVSYFNTISRYFSPGLYKSYIDYKEIIEGQSDLQKNILAKRVQSSLEPSLEHTQVLKHKI